MKTPEDILSKFEDASEGLEYGIVVLTLELKQGKPRYVIAKQESIIPIDEKSRGSVLEVHMNLEGKHE